MRMLANSEADLLLALHNGIFEQPLWQSFLERLRAMAGANYSSLVFRTADSSPTTLLFSSQSPATESHRDLSAQLLIDALPLHRMRQERVYSFAELVEPYDPAMNELYNTTFSKGRAPFLRSMRVTDTGGTDAWVSLINMSDFYSSPSFLLSRLAPHLRNAVRTYATLEKERSRSSISAEALGRLNFGWVALDQSCRIIDTTDNIQGLLQCTSVLWQGRHGHLTFSSATIEKEVHALVRDIAAGRSTRPRAINLSRDPWIDMLVTAIPASYDIAPGSSATAIAYLSGDRRSRTDPCEQLVDLFGLLPSEARLAWAIAQGSTIAEAGAELGLTLETARNYSKKVYFKTGAKGQSDLVRIIFSSVLIIA